MYSPQWGCLIWDTLLLLAIYFPEKNPSKEQIEYFYNAIMGVVHLLPCHGCIGHAVLYVSKNPPVDLDTREKCIDYIVTFHNDVNKQTGRRIFTVKEAISALELRLTAGVKDLPRAVQIRMEDSQKITELQKQLTAIGGGAAPPSTTSETSPYAYVSIALGILSFFLIITVIVLAKKAQKKKM